jgi:glycosyltransferase involved in cell wall biosynthesis
VVRPIEIAVDVTPLVGAMTGVATFTNGAVRALASRDDVRLTAYGMTLRGRRELAGVVPTGVQVVDRPMPAGLLTRMWSSLDLPPGDWWTGPVDVVHGTNFVVPPMRRAAEVVMVHDLTAVRFPELCSPTSLRYPRLVQRAVARGAWVHTPSAAVADEVMDAFEVSPDRVRSIHSGLDEAAPGEAALGQAIAGSDSYILALGTVEPRKGLGALVRAFDRLAATRPELRLVVAGPDGWGTHDFKAAVAMSRNGDRVVRTGWIEVGTRRDLLAGARLLAVPSVYEGFGYPPLEAMAMGTPVVATAVGSLPEVLGDAAVLVPGGDIDALTEGIAAVLDDENTAANLVERGRARAATFRWDRCAQGLLELYRSAADARG